MQAGENLGGDRRPSSKFQHSLPGPALQYNSASSPACCLQIGLGANGCGRWRGEEAGAEEGLGGWKGRREGLRQSGPGAD